MWRIGRWSGCPGGRKRISDLLMACRRNGGLCLGRHALGPRHARLVLGFEASSGGVPGFSLLFGTTLRFPRRLFFCCHARQRRGFGDLFGTKLLVRQIGRVSFGVGARAGKPRKFFLLAGPCSGCDRKFRCGEFAALGICQRSLFRLDSRAQCDFGQAFDMSLLRRRRLGRGLRGGATNRMIGREFFCLLPPLRRGDLLGRMQLPRFGGGTGAFLGAGASQRVGLGGPFGIGRVRGREIADRDELPALPLHILQFLQQFAQASPQAPDTIANCRSG